MIFLANNNEDLYGFKVLTLYPARTYLFQSTIKRISGYKASWAGTFREKVFPYLPLNSHRKHTLQKESPPST